MSHRQIFLVGNTVKCIQENSGFFGTLGQIYTIKSLDRDETSYNLMFEEMASPESECPVDGHRFELCAPIDALTPPQVYVSTVEEIASTLDEKSWASLLKLAPMTILNLESSRRYKLKAAQDHVEMIKEQLSSLEKSLTDQIGIVKDNQ